MGRKTLLLLSIFIIHLFAQCQQLNKMVKNAGIRILFTPGAPANVFIPSESFGAAYDGHTEGENKHILTPENIKAMRSVGLKPISYRLRTELGCEAWHWNAKGSWSEKEKEQGYWISDNDANNDIQVSNGYYLPRRGNTHDQANDDGYSRIDDNDTATFWKSNPYLDQFYTGDDNSIHPQWVIVDLGKTKQVNAIRINWANPFALSYKVDYAFDIGKDYFEPFNPGLWHPFSKGLVKDQKGTNDIIPISDKPVSVRFIRITMSESSGSANNITSDHRDNLGFAIKELSVGLLKHGNFTDNVIHSANNKIQSVIHVSSTDPWHRAIDIDKSTEQAGIDLFFKSGLNNNAPSLFPIGLLYDNPENMAALIKYLALKNYPVFELEMGEEPEGQLIDPADYAALYLQWANKIKQVNPGIKMGGPGFAALAFTEDDKYTFTERQWTIRFLDYLKSHNGMGHFNFFSTEWYPFDDICAPTAPQLAIATKMLSIALKDFKETILPSHTPLYITEYGYSAYGGRAEVEIEGALMYADILGQFMMLGGTKSFLYGYEPAFLDQTNNCDWGNNMLFGMDDSGRITFRTAAFYGVQMLMQKWAQPADSLLAIYPASTSALNKDGLPLIAVYPIYRPDHKWSVLIINKNPQESYRVSIAIENKRTGKKENLHFPLDIYQYSGRQYKWYNDKGEGHPTRSLPPEHKKAQKEEQVVVPPYSLTVINE